MTQHHEPPPKQKTALVLLIDPPVMEVCRETVEGMGHVCRLAKNEAEALDILKNEAIDLLVCTIRDKADDFAFFDKAVVIRPLCRSIAIIDESLEEFFPAMLLRAYPRNLIADNHPPDFLELRSTIQKLLSNSIFGMDKYGVSPHVTVKLESSGLKYEMIAKARDFYASQGVSERIIQNVELIANELLMNAIFDAPVDKSGERIYFQRERSEVFDLKPGERPTFSFGINEQRLAVSVANPFGTFKQETFFSCVNRCFVEKTINDEKSQGAGMGLFMAFKSLSQLVINVSERQETEFIALIDWKSSARDMKKKRRSFHYFRWEPNGK